MLTIISYFVSAWRRSRIRQVSAGNSSTVVFQRFLRTWRLRKHCEYWHSEILESILNID